MSQFETGTAPPLPQSVLQISVESIEAIIFDLDGTILDTQNELFNGIVIAANKMTGKDITFDDVFNANVFGAPLLEIFNVFVLPYRKENVVGGEENEDLSLIDREIEEFTKHFVDAVNLEPPSNVFNDVLLGLETIKTQMTYKNPKAKEFKMGIATTKPSPTAMKDLTSINVCPSLINTHFEIIQGTDKEHGIKPKPEPDVIIACAKRLRVDISKTVCK